MIEITMKDVSMSALGIFVDFIRVGEHTPTNNGGLRMRLVRSQVYYHHHERDFIELKKCGLVADYYGIDKGAYTVIIYIVVPVDHAEKIEALRVWSKL